MQCFFLPGRWGKKKVFYYPKLCFLLTQLVIKGSILNKQLEQIQKFNKLTRCYYYCWHFCTTHWISLILQVHWESVTMRDFNRLESDTSGTSGPAKHNLPSTIPIHLTMANPISFESLVFSTRFKNYISTSYASSSLPLANTNLAQ